MIGLGTKIAAGVAIAAIVGCVGLGWQLKRAWQAEAVASDALRASEATVKHMQKDAADSARIVGAYAAEIAQLQELAAHDRLAIIRAPVTTGCSARPAIRAAIDGRLPVPGDRQPVR